MHATLRGTPRIFARAGIALLLMTATACSEDDPVAPVATELTIVSGDDQTIAVSTPSAPLTVSVLDQDDDPMAGRTVTWSITSGTGTLATTTSVTNAEGEASVVFTAGVAAGAVTVTATVTGLAPVTFDIAVQ